jgi:hypothetical protein
VLGSKVQALVDELRLADVLVAVIAFGWLADRLLEVRDQRIWSAGYVAGAAGAQLRAELAEEPA